MHKLKVQNQPLPKASLANPSQEFFKGRILLTPAEAGAACGWAKQTVYNKLNHDNFPIPLVKFSGRKMVRISDLLDFVAKLDAPLGNKTNTRTEVGRPPKAESILRKAKKLKGAI